MNETTWYRIVTQTRLEGSLYEGTPCVVSTKSKRINAGNSWTPRRRIIWEVMVGEIPYRGVISPICKTRECLNVTHLKVTTRADLTKMDDEAYLKRVWERLVRFTTLDSNMFNDTPCCLWTGAKGDGYGLIDIRGVTKRTHRVVWELINREIPTSLVIDHLCRQRSCVNVAHMDLVTNRENIARGLAAQRLVERIKARTHCPSGHPYDESNTRLDQNGHRHCKECGRIRNKKRYERVKHEPMRIMPGTGLKTA